MIKSIHLFRLTSSAPVKEYVAKNGTNVFVLKKDAIATISGGTEYSNVQINSSDWWGYSASKQINNTVNFFIMINFLVKQ